VDEILSDLPDYDRADGGGQRLSQHAEKARSGHEDQPVELMLLIPCLNLRGDPASEELGLMLARPPLAARPMVSRGAPPASLGGGVIVDAPGTIGLEVTVVQMRQGIGEPAGGLQARVAVLGVIESGFALVGDHDTYAHFSAPSATQAAAGRAIGPCGDRRRHA
jgi:hypothetical protein